MGYPIETVLAEKLVTMIDRGDTNTRDRDFADVWLLTRRHRVDARSVRAAIDATAAHRDVALRPLADALVRLPLDRGIAWGRYLDRAGLREVPHSLATVISDIAAFADPLLTGELSDASWDPLAREWSS